MCIDFVISAVFDKGSGRSKMADYLMKSKDSRWWVDYIVFIKFYVTDNCDPSGH